jgi:hypothetical protein
MNARPRILLAAILIVVACTLVWHVWTLRAQSRAAATPPLSGDPAHPTQATNWVDTRLYFGLAPDGDTRRASSDAQWQEFLDREVTPRFPAGLSVIDVNGQWQGIGNPAPVHVRTKLLIIDYPNTAENIAKIEDIRTAWKQRTHDQSVLKVTQPADVSF